MCTMGSRFSEVFLDLNNPFSFDSKQKRKSPLSTSLAAKPYRPVRHDSLLSKARVDRLLQTEKWSGRKWKSPGRHSGEFIFLYSPYLPQNSQQKSVPDLNVVTVAYTYIYDVIRDLSRDDCIEEFIKRIWSSGLVWAVGLQSGLQWLKNSQMH